MRIVLLCGNKPNQIALANKVANQFDLVGIVSESKIVTKNITLSWKLVQKIGSKFFFKKIDAAWNNLMSYYAKRFPVFPMVELLEVENVNLDSVLNFISTRKPDIIIVSGTSLIKEGILKLDIPMGILNLHTGLSPYINGGPNCTNWCLALDQFHLIGNTIMYLDKGIDSGNIVLSDVVPFKGYESLTEIHRKVMEHAHELYIKVLDKIKKEGKSISSIRQLDIYSGITFYARQWTWRQKFNLLWNIRGNRFRNTLVSGKYRELQKGITLVEWGSRRNEALINS